MACRLAELRLHQSLELDLPFDDFDHVFDILALLLFLQILGFLADKFLESSRGQFVGIFAGPGLGLHKGLVEAFYIFGLTIRIDELLRIRL